MKKNHLPLLGLVTLFTLITLIAFSQKKHTETATPINWASFLAQHDLVWTKLPTNYYDAPFVGNGLLGTLFFKDTTLPHTIGFEIGRVDVYDHPSDDSIKAIALPRHRMRLPIGKLLLSTIGEITSSNFRVNLWDATITGKIATKNGTIDLLCYVPSNEKVILIKYKATGEEKALNVSFRPEQGDNSRSYLRPNTSGKPYQKNPPFIVSKEDDAEIITQPLLSGDDYATAWNKKFTKDGYTIVYVTVANNWAERKMPYNKSATTALKQLKLANATDETILKAAHLAWWHQYYPASFVSIPDARMESFYWIQQYRLASAGRPNLPAIDLLGPWYKPSVWLAMWNNLNVQLAYYTTGITNHLDMEEPIFNLLENHQQELIENVPKEFQNDCAGLGNPNIFNNVSVKIFLTKDTASKQKMNLIALPWLMQQFYLHYRYNMDENRLRQTIYPMMKRAFGVYSRILYKSSDGKFHLPLSFSDEYGEDKDVSLNIALARWGFKTLIETANHLQIKDTMLPIWKNLLANIVETPTDERGIRIGRNLSFDKPHRHYSHLFSIFPLYEMNIEDNPDILPLMEKSLRNFTSLDGDNCMFKFNGAASLWAALGNGDEALKWTKRSIEFISKGPTVTPNGFYSENKWPTFESPIASTRSMLDMMLQSWGKSIRIFPAMPAEWKETNFENLRAEGAFLVSAVRKEGKTSWVKLKSEAGSPCNIQVKDWEGIELKGSNASVSIKSLGKGLFSLNLKKGETITIYPANKRELPTISPITHAPETWNQWGVHGDL